MRLLSWLENYRLLHLALLSLLALLALAGSTVEARIAYILSTSPLNDFVTGTSSFYHELQKAGYHVVLASPKDLPSLAGTSRCLVYMLIGPDKPLEDSEAKLVAKLYREGKLSIIVADETGAANNLLSMLNAPVVGGYVTAPPRLTGNPYIVPIRCTGTVALSSKVAALANTGGGRLVCWSYNGRAWLPLAVMVEGRHGKLLVIGDSSIFANFEFNGLYGFPPTKTIALKLVRLVAGQGCTIALDNAHYLAAKLELGRVALLTGKLLLALPPATVDVILSKQPLIALAATLAAAVLAAVYLVGTPSRPEPPRSDVELYTRNSLELLEELETAAQQHPQQQR